MKYAILYSSRTGNTEAVARAICSALPGEVLLSAADDTPDAVDADVCFVGCWVDKGTADEKARELLKKLKGKKLALFVTLGAYPFSKHALESQLAIWKLAAEENEVLGCFACQGRVAPALAEKFKALPPGHPHAMNAARALRHEEAALHPNAIDLRNAMEFARVITQRVIPGLPNP